ncbi:hypothetical protein MMC11_005655 [Xylographa trunciseda]|nr:hypothetical protein [Xylographa trunciseda]
MDPLSLAASITALLQLTSTVVGYLNNVKEASKERAQVAVEASMVYSLLTSLKYRVEDADPDDAWYTAVRVLGQENGAIDQYQAALELLAANLDTRHGTKIGRALMWKFDKVEIMGILSKIERLKSLISVALTNDLFTLSKAMKEDISSIRKHVESVRVDAETETRQAIARWLTPLDFKARQRDIFCRRQDGTGEWLLDSPEFQTWVTEPGQVLYCSGMPGAGKTVLASIVVDYLQKKFSETSVLTTCIYCNYKEKDNQTAQDLLASLLKQLVQDCESLSEKVTALYKDHTKRRTRLPPEDLIQALQLEIARYPRVFIIVDALDECTEEGNRRMDLMDGVRSLPRNANLLITSRHNRTIETEFEGTRTLEINATDSDITRYVLARIQCEHRLARHVRTHPALQQSIVNGILRGAKGMFLLAQLHMDSLVNKSNRKAVDKALEHLPKEIGSTYDEAMARIRAQNNDDKELGEKVLLWISFALRPLSIIELQHALAIDDTSTKTDLDALPDEQIVVSVCAGLIMVDSESGIVRLIHHTTQEYFNRTRGSHFANARNIVLAACIKYLYFEEFGTGFCTDLGSFRSRLNENALLDYVARFWGYHAWVAENSPTEDELLYFLQDSVRVSCFGQVMFQNYGNFGRSANTTGMHLAAYFGSSVLVMKLWEKGMSAESLDFMGQTPLIMAVKQGHFAVVELLVCRAEVQINAADEESRTALHWAAFTGQEEIVNFLLDHDADVTARMYRQQTPLHRAAEEGHFGAVKLLIAAGSEVNALTDTKTTPLYRAARRGHVEVIEMLLAAGADVNIPTWNGYTALRSAAGYNQLGSVKILLTANPALDVRDEYGLTALDEAKESGFKDITRILQDAEDATISASRSKVVLVENPRISSVRPDI